MTYWQAVFTIIGLLGAFSIPYAIYDHHLGRPKHVENLKRRLSGNRDFWSQYDALISMALDWTDRFFEKSKTSLDEPPNPWSARSFDRLLLLALIYPFGTALAGWIAFGEAGEFGEAIGLAKESDPVPRAAILAAFLAFGFSFWKFSRAKGWTSVVWLIATFAVTFAFAGAGAGAIAVAVAVAFAGAVATLLAYRTLDQPTSPHRLWWLLLPLTILVLGSVYGFAWFSAAEADDSFTVLATALVLIPLLNLPFDFFSTGFTRWAIRRRTQHKTIGRMIWGFADFAVALLCLVLLAMTLVIGLELFNAAALRGGAEGPPLPVAGQLQELAEADGFEGRFFWLYFALFSTLLPSVVHLSIAMFSLISWAFIEPTKWISRTLDNPERLENDRPKVALAISAQWVLATFIALMLVRLLFEAFVGLAPLLGGTFLQKMTDVQVLAEGWFYP